MTTLSFDDGKEGILEAPGDGAGLAGTDLTIVDLADRRHLGRGSREKCFLGNVEVVPRQALFLNRDPKLRGQRHNCGACDALEH